MVEEVAVMVIEGNKKKKTEKKTGKTGKDLFDGRVLGLAVR